VRGDGGKHDLRRRDGEVRTMVFAHAEGEHAHVVGQHCLVDEIPKHGRLR
jgi:hypothetical protein